MSIDGSTGNVNQNRKNQTRCVVLNPGSLLGKSLEGGPEYMQHSTNWNIF